jgi:outer membrane immunogenic protein
MSRPVGGKCTEFLADEWCDQAVAHTQDSQDFTMGVIMNKLLLATLSIGALTISVAKAADIRAPAPVVVAPACAQFGGWYIGIQGGAIAQRHEVTDLDDFFVNRADHVANRRISGFIGPQAGWNWQWNCTVFGVQADWSWTGGRHEHSIDGGWWDGNHNHKARWFGTVRARSGVVVNNLLLYVSGGFAFANQRSEFVFNSDYGDHVNFSHSKTRHGLAVGAGTEWSFANNWSINSEFLYMAFERDRRAFNCATLCGPFPVGTPFRFEHQNDAWVGRVGLNYRFGGFGGGPVLARY